MSRSLSPWVAAGGELWAPWTACGAHSAAGGHELSLEPRGQWLAHLCCTRPSFWDAPSIPGAHLAAQTFTGCWESLATHSKFILICAWPKMGLSLKERSATKTRCLSPPEDKSPAIAQATGRKQTQILSSESLAGAGCSILAKRTLPLGFVPAFVRSPLPIKRGLGESHSPWEQPGGAGLAAGGLRRARKASPKISLLFPARILTALHRWRGGSICHE